MVNRRGQETLYIPEEEQKRFEPSPVRRERLRREAAERKALEERAKSQSSRFKRENKESDRLGAEDSGIDDYRKACIAAGIASNDIDQDTTNTGSKMSDNVIVLSTEEQILKQQKKKRQLSKKLRQISELKDKSSEELDDDQKDKLSKENQFKIEMSEVDKLLTSLSLSASSSKST